jgi:hypothetical protein
MFVIAVPFIILKSFVDRKANPEIKHGSYTFSIQVHDAGQRPAPYLVTQGEQMDFKNTVSSIN